MIKGVIKLNTHLMSVYRRLTHITVTGVTALANVNKSFTVREILGQSSWYDISMNRPCLIPQRSFSVKEDSRNLTVAILGPPNAGKSTLFNRLMCKESNKSYALSSDKNPRKIKRSNGRIGHNNPSDRQGGAIVSSTPGTTRDRRECIGRIGDTFFTLVDTAGVDSERIDLLVTGKSKKDPMEVAMMKQTLEAAKQSDLILLLFDARVGLTTDLEETCEWLRKIDARHFESNALGEDRVWTRRVIIVANKLEGDYWTNYFDNDSPVMQHLAEVSRLGFGEAIPISAEHGEGLSDLAIIIQEMASKKRYILGIQSENNTTQTNAIIQASSRKDEKPLHMAILGRQNVGKSTLVNALLKEERVITGDRPGLTRDAIAVKWSWKGRPVHLVDTAGIRRMAKRDHSDDIEDMAVRDAMRAMKVADVAVLVLDADAKLLQRQELAIADAVVREGRSLVVAANKMDLLVDTEYTKEDYATGVRDQIEKRFPMLRRTPVVPMSSLTGDCVDDLMPVVFNARDRWARVISTGLLNRWIYSVLESQAPPAVNGRPVKIKYVMQTKGRPPTFLLFCNVDALPASYLRYLTKNFQETFGMFGMEVRLAVKKSSVNPYHDKEKSTRIGMGIGGREARKKRLIAALKSTGKPLSKKVRKRFQKR